MCQVVEDTQLICPEKESGGLQCESMNCHNKHFVSEHSMKHSLMGNGYSCSYVDNIIDRQLTLF